MTSSGDVVQQSSSGGDWPTICVTFTNTSGKNLEHSGVFQMYDKMMSDFGWNRMGQLTARWPHPARKDQFLSIESKS